MPGCAHYRRHDSAMVLKFLVLVGVIFQRWEREKRSITRSFSLAHPPAILRYGACRNDHCQIILMYVRRVPEPVSSVTMDTSWAKENDHATVTKRCWG